ncbi:carboxypeptidase regulatory-like domain-containing protein [Myxococcus sp. K15C18031901]|uniref:carboxypeptidase regulatory-like domain-containing protein n=1 Tax=Myxococcus dinghuensis TaxID=2906761 RepID=UPI0020A81D11|nr:carboxypeptidase regulatory-like domain-containing protein [Myxococcus dinghuensis]MCP3097269.1 carboxypeptidase regulatory-like domain-containing protein [Myxococcus dinghuensis]
MRAPRHPWFIAWGALAFMGACGGFNNGPLEEGTVRGRLLGAEADVAHVSVLGQPDLRASVAADGRFELTRVPATSVELFLVATRTRAARARVEPQGARVTDLGDIDAPQGAFVTVRMRDADGKIPSRGEVEVEGTTLDDLKLDTSTGEVRVGPLPAGCYTLEVQGDKHGKVEEEVCVREGESLVRDFILRGEDDDDGGTDDDGGD